MDPLWNQFRPLAEINAYIDTKTGRIPIMMVREKEVVPFFYFSQQDRWGAFFDYVETYSESLVKKTDA